MSVLEMLLGKLVFDSRLSFHQPIHRGIKLMHIHLTKLQFFGQRMLGGLGLQRRGGAQL